MTKWYTSNETILDFVKFLVDTELISTEQELTHFVNNIQDYDAAYTIYAKEIKGEIVDKLNEIREES